MRTLSANLVLFGVLAGAIIAALIAAYLTLNPSLAFTVPRYTELSLRGIGWLVAFMAVEMLFGYLFFGFLRFSLEINAGSHWANMGMLVLAPGLIVFMLSVFFLSLTSFGLFDTVRCGTMNNWHTATLVTWDAFLKGFLGDLMESFHIDLVRCSSTNLLFDSYDFFVRTLAELAFFGQAALFVRTELLRPDDSHWRIPRRWYWPF